MEIDARSATSIHESLDAETVTDDEREPNVETALKQEIWRLLPDDAIEKVMMNLPLLSLLRVRCVSRSWNSAISSNFFADMYCRGFKQDTWLLIFPNNDYAAGLAYDPSLRRWFDLPLSFLPFESKVVATAHGMLCMIPKSNLQRGWLACNPITKSWMPIPCPPGLLKLFFLVVGLFVEQDSTFKVVMAGSELVAEDSEQFILKTQVYDSRSRSWNTGGSLLLDAPLSPWRATCQGIMYCVTGSIPYKVFAYHVKQSTWFNVRARMPDDLTSVRLIDHNGKLLMVGGIEENNITTAIGLWKLNATGTQWMEMHWMPEKYSKDLLLSMTKRFVCIGQGDFLFFSNKRCKGILEHNIHARTWHWVPVNSIFMNIHYNMLRGFHFQPSL